MKVSDIICSDKYRDAFPTVYKKTDLFIHGSIPALHGAKLIITGHSDYSITTPIYEHYAPNHWFSINAESPYVHGLPLGITNPEFAVYGNQSQMKEVYDRAIERSRLLYMNFNVATFPSERTHVLQLFQERPYVTYEPHEASLRGRERYLMNLKSHKFTLCPRGNGIDTHRIWESLYMGCIPIVKRNIVHKDWLDLPILWIDDWSSITQDSLETAYASMHWEDYALEKLTISYWIDKVNGVPQ